MVAINYAWNPVFDCITKETDDAGATVAKYTQEPKLYGGLISQRRSGATSFYHYDAIGTTRALTSSSQAVTDSAVYTAFGEKVASAGTTVNPYGFVGKVGYQTDSATAVSYVRARHLYSIAANWLSIDPNGFIDGINQHLYVGNRPTIRIDPSGHAAYWPENETCRAAYNKGRVDPKLTGGSDGGGVLCVCEPFTFSDEQKRFFAKIYPGGYRRSCILPWPYPTLSTPPMKTLPSGPIKLVGPGEPVGLITGDPWDKTNFKCERCAFITDTKFPQKEFPHRDILIKLGECPGVDECGMIHERGHISLSTVEENCIGAAGITRGSGTRANVNLEECILRFKELGCLLGKKAAATESCKNKIDLLYAYQLAYFEGSGKCAGFSSQIYEMLGSEIHIRRGQIP